MFYGVSFACSNLMFDRKKTVDDFVFGVIYFYVCHPIIRASGYSKKEFSPEDFEFMRFDSILNDCLP